LIGIGGGVLEAAGFIAKDIETNSTQAADGSINISGNECH
jgi:hypothetical protein